jgi:NADH-quinone oxidoreductase subunit M
MLQRVFYGPPQNKFNKTKDADILERVYMFVFVAVIMLVGIYPAILTDIIKAGVMPVMGLLGG